MTKQSYPLFLEGVKLPDVLDASSSFTLMLAMECDAPVDLSALHYEVKNGEMVIASGVAGQIIRFNPDAPDYDPRNGPVEKRDQIALSLTAPKEIAPFSWTITVPEQELGDCIVEAASLTFSATTLIHRSSLAVWDVPSPVQAGETFRIKIGGKCSAGCALCGLDVMVCDASQEVARGALQNEHTDAAGLWCTEVEVKAPTTTGLQDFTIHFAPGDTRGLPHAQAQAQFSVMVTKAPDHAVDVSVVDEESGAPITDAYVRLGLYRVATQCDGLARFAVPKGEHRLFIWKAGFDIPEKNLLVDDDLCVTIAAKALPKKDPYARWQG
jgi:hypothetical protein